MDYMIVLLKGTRQVDDSGIASWSSDTKRHEHLLSLTAETFPDSARTELHSMLDKAIDRLNLKQ